MTKNSYRDGMKVSPSRISLLRDDELDALMLQLLRAQAYKCGADITQVFVNTEERAKDEGSDGWTPAPTRKDPWLGDAPTCWQFKAGTAGQPSRIAKEVLKPIPRATLVQGGRFVLIASGSTNGVSGVRSRLDALKPGADAAGIPTQRIEVLGSEQLANWCNEHPAIAAEIIGNTIGAIPFAKWAQSRVHQVSWQSSEHLDGQIDELRRELDIQSGNYLHLHIHGHPGVGKTRFALELCRNAPWREFVVYVPQANESVTRIIDGVANDHQSALTIVADEVQYDQLRPLRDALDYADGRVRLITIGHSHSPEPARIQSFSLTPLSTDALIRIVSGWHPSMPREHAEFVATFADGYVRLAKLAADAVMNDRTIDVRGLLNQAHIREVLDRMLGSGNRRSLHVVAALTSVGWTGDRQEEGRAIAVHFGLDWRQVQADVERFHRELGIAPIGGRLRYLSPTPLANHLAIEAWESYPDLMRDLVNVLPSEAARVSYFDRLRLIASSPQAREFAREELGSFFFLASSFVDERAAKRWSALSTADPLGAAKGILRAIRSASLSERLEISGSARSVVVGTLARLAWRTDSFHDATVTLALLAEAENANWSNNATGEFIEKFQIHLGGTAVPYRDRIKVLDELLASESSELEALVIKALSQVGKQNETRVGGPDDLQQLPEPEWRPQNSGEHIDCIRLACSMLEAIAKRKTAESLDQLLSAAVNLAMLLRHRGVRQFVVAFYRSLRRANPDTREPLRRQIASIIEKERRYWKELPENDLTALLELHEEFTDDSLSGRLRQYIGPSNWELEQPDDLVRISKDLLNATSTFQEEWPWLTSGEAGDGWRLGEALADADQGGDLGEIMLSFPARGPDQRIIAGYAAQRRNREGDSWFESFNSRLLERSETRLMIELFWRVGATEATAKMLANALRESDVEEGLLGQLSFGRWQEALSDETLHDVLLSLLRLKQHEVVVTVLYHRLKDRPADIANWKLLGLQLVTDTKLIRSSHMASHYWKKLALKLLPSHSAEIIGAIFREQSLKDGEHSWFLEFSDAKDVLEQAVKTHPSVVWDQLSPYLSGEKGTTLFHIGFPEGLVDQIPAHVILDWIRFDPPARASAVARVSGTDFSSDDTLASQVIGAFGDDPSVASSFFSQYVSGSWMGKASSHWESLAATLEDVSTRTNLHKLGNWARSSMTSLRRMAEQDRLREEEERLRRR